MGKFWYMRHGQTYFNVENDKWYWGERCEGDREFKYSLDYVDSRLTELGIEQVLESKEDILKLHIDVVYVSPLLRTLQTCAYVFEDCENKPKILVNPHITECVHISQDVPLYPNDYREQFNWFDWSLMPESYYITEILKNQHTKTFMNRISENPEVNLPKELLSIMKNISPAFVETDAEVYIRAQKFKENLIQELRCKNIFVIGHSSFFRRFTSVMISDTEFRGMVFLENGQFIQYIP